MKYDLVIIGASAVALGLARTVQHKLKTLVIHGTEMVAAEYVNAFKEAELYTQAASYYRQYRELQVDVMLNTALVASRKQEDGYELEVLHAGGFWTISTQAVVDTTLPLEVERASKSLNAILIQQQGEELAPLVWSPQITLLPDAQTDGYRTVILKFACEQEWEVGEARHRLVEQWLNRPEWLSRWKMAAIAYCFEEEATLDTTSSEHADVLLPAASFGDVEEALAAGAAYGRRLLAG